MTEEERRLIVETLSEIKELKGEMREFKQHVIYRVEKLERKDADRSKERLSVFSVVIAFIALAMNFIVNFLRNGGK